MMMMMIEVATAVRFPSDYRPALNLDEPSGALVSSRRGLLPGAALNLDENKFRRFFNGNCFERRGRLKNRIRASSENPGSDPSKLNGRLRYHPFEDIAQSTLENGGDLGLTAQETSRTIVEVNSKATLMLTGLIGDEFHENIIWPDLPYVTDEHGNIYFQVKNDEDFLQTVTSENNFVQAIIGFDAMEMISEMELLGPSEIDFGIEEIEDQGSDVEEGDDDDEDDEDDDYEEDYVAVLDDEEEEVDSDETLGDWAKLETMRSSHPMYFAKKLTQVATDDPVDWMEQPPAGLAVQGLIRPAFIEEHSDIQRHMSSNQSHCADISQDVEKPGRKVEDLTLVNGQELKLGSPEDTSSWSEELEKAEVPINGTSFYKLEMIKIQLISAHGAQTMVEVEDFKEAQPDVIALSAAKIISRLKDGGEKITEAFKSLCWRCKGIQVEEAALIAIDSLGFDIRVCSGTQIETLRFAFNSRATSEYSAEKQLNDLLFPRIHHKQPRKKQTHQK